MHDTQGHRYEVEVNNKLFSEGLIFPKWKPVPGSSSQPDCKIVYRAVAIDIELKLGIGDADFGQLSVKHDGRRWYLNQNTKNISTLNTLKSSGIERAINEIWDFPPPFKFSKKRGTKLTPEQWAYDRSQFKDIMWEAPQNTIAKFYGGKGVNYIQIKGFGLYRIPNTPETIRKKIPLFTPTVYARVRYKPKSSGGIPDYDYSCDIGAMVGKNLQKSPFDLMKDTSFLKL